MASKERGSLTRSRLRRTTIKKRQRIHLFQGLPCLLASLKALMLNSFNAEHLSSKEIIEITAFHQSEIYLYGEEPEGVCDKAALLQTSHKMNQS